MARGRKSVYKRGGVYWLRYALPNGKIQRESSGSSVFTFAQAKLTERRKETDEGKDPTPVRIIANATFDTLTTDYLTWAERQRGIRSKRGFVKALKAAFGHLPLRNLTTKLVEQYQTERIKKGNKPATANRHIATIKHMATKAVEWEMMDEGVKKKIHRVKLLDENNKKLRYLEKDEIRALVAACSNHLRPIVITMIHTGMRKEEALSLRWDDHIDLARGLVLLEAGKTKSGKPRQIPIDATLRTTLQGIVRRVDSPYVFVNQKGNRYKDIKKSFESACRKAKIKEVTPHTCRHTFASHLVMAGVNITTVKELLGHATLTMTLRYAHLAPNFLAGAVAALDAALREKEDPKEGQLTQSTDTVLPIGQVRGVVNT